MRTLTTLLGGALLCSTLSAQDVIVRQRNGVPDFFYLPNTVASLQTVINSSFDGDTIYLPGVNYTINADLTINKSVVIIGSGIRPDSTDAYTARTRFVQGSSDYVFLANNAGGSASGIEFHGISFSGAILIGTSTGTNHATTNVAGAKFNRCEINFLGLHFSGSNNTLASNTVISSCLIGTLRINQAANTMVRNSIIGALTYANNGTTVVNCIFRDFNQATNNNNASVVYRSNIFLRATAANYAITEASTFQNNLWVVQGTSTVSWPSAVSATNNQQTNNLSNVFVNNTSFTTFDFANNYHVVPGPYQTMGFDNGEVGVYGTTGQPMKEGLLPFNPHWINLSAPGSTSGGTLQNVNIKGSAQTH